MKKLIENMNPIEAVRQMLGDLATEEDAERVYEALQERGITIAKAADMDSAEWLELVEKALEGA